MSDNHTLSSVQKHEIISKIRSFQRSYSRQLRLLNLRIDKNMPFSLVDARIMFEIDNCPGCTAAHVSKNLFLDRAAVSRAIHRLINDNYIYRSSVANDKRAHTLHLTETGKTFLESAITSSSSLAQTRLLDKLTPEESLRLAELLEEADEIIRSISD